MEVSENLSYGPILDGLLTLTHVECEKYVGNLKFRNLKQLRGKIC